jgi:hypothetical protein
MYALVALREGKKVECVPGFASRRDALLEARRLNSLPTHWRNADGKVYHRPYWEVVSEDATPGSCRRG